MLVDLIGKDITGKDADAALGKAHITVNKNAVPNDPRSPFVTSGLRIGTPAVTTRGFGSFEWYFSYGALDLGARGTWTRLGDAVELVVVDMGFPPQVPQAKFERMRLRIDGATWCRAWPWDMDGFGKGAERGRYQRLSP
jgi:hypothetical protein